MHTLPKRGRTFITMAAPIKFMFPSILDHFGKQNPHAAVSRTRSYQSDILIQNHTDRHQKCLLVGEQDSGKTALLFQCAVSLAQDGHPVTFITPTKFQCLPPAVEGAPPPDPLLMKQINIMYFDDRPALFTYLSGIHTRPSLPHSIILDNVDYYGNHPQTGDTASNVSTLCAYLVDAITFLSSKRNQSTDPSAGEGCLLLASVACPTQGDLPLGHIYKHFLPTELQINKTQDNVFQLTSHKNGAVRDDCIITYKLGHSITVLDILMGEEASSTFSQLSCTSQGPDENG